jgi:hypothetical protein
MIALLVWMLEPLLRAFDPAQLAVVMEWPRRCQGWSLKEFKPLLGWLRWLTYLAGD